MVALAVTALRLSFVTPLDWKTLFLLDTMISSHLRKSRMISLCLVSFPFFARGRDPFLSAAPLWQKYGCLMKKVEKNFPLFLFLFFLTLQERPVRCTRLGAHMAHESHDFGSTSAHTDTIGPPVQRYTQSLSPGQQTSLTETCPMIIALLSKETSGYSGTMTRNP